jgi:hypothetical protein
MSHELQNNACVLASFTNDSKSMLCQNHEIRIRRAKKQFATQLQQLLAKKQFATQLQQLLANCTLRSKTLVCFTNQNPAHDF